MIRDQVPPYTVALQSGCHRMAVHGGHDLCHKTKFSEENCLSNHVMQFPEPHMLTLKKKSKKSDMPIKPVNRTMAMELWWG